MKKRKKERMKEEIKAKRRKIRKKETIKRQGRVAWSNGYHLWLPLWSSSVPIPLKDNFLSVCFVSRTLKRIFSYCRS